VVLDALGLADAPCPAPQDLRRRSVDRLVRAWGEDPIHVDLVARVASGLFEDTATLHRPAAGAGVAPARRPTARGRNAHLARTPPQARRLPDRERGYEGVHPDDIAAIATLVRFHRGKDPRPVYPPFADLPPKLQQACVTLTGFLRVAHAIGRGDEDHRLRVGAQVRRGRVQVAISGAGNPDAAIAEARQAAPLLEGSLGLELTFEVGASAPA
jgi:hypothetical protein